MTICIDLQRIVDMTCSISGAFWVIYTHWERAKITLKKAQISTDNQGTHYRHNLKQVRNFICKKFYFTPLEIIRWNPIQILGIPMTWHVTTLNNSRPHPLSPKAKAERYHTIALISLSLHFSLFQAKVRDFPDLFSDISLISLSQLWSGKSHFFVSNDFLVTFPLVLFADKRTKNKF